MIRELKRLAAIVGLAAFWFGSTYFAVAALFPQFALQAGLIAAMLGLAGYLLLLGLDMADEGMPLGLLVTLPIVILTGGVIWWGLRLLGLWPPRTE
jgi:hypothetical protein